MDATNAMSQAACQKVSRGRKQMSCRKDLTIASVTVDSANGSPKMFPKLNRLRPDSRFNPCILWSEGEPREL